MLQTKYITAPIFVHFQSSTMPCLPGLDWTKHLWQTYNASATANIQEEYLFSSLVKPDDAPEENTNIKDSKCQNYHKRYKRCALDLGATSAASGLNQCIWKEEHERNSVYLQCIPRSQWHPCDRPQAFLVGSGTPSTHSHWTAAIAVL